MEPDEISTILGINDDENQNEEEANSSSSKPDSPEESQEDEDSGANALLGDPKLGGSPECDEDKEDSLSIATMDTEEAEPEEEEESVPALSEILNGEDPLGIDEQEESNAGKEEIFFKEDSSPEFFGFLDGKEDGGLAESSVDYSNFEERESTKKGRKQVEKKIQFKQLPSAVTEDLDSSVIEELQYGYEILQSILAIGRIQPFLVRPDPSLYGLKSYYNIISKPMWLHEVERKLFDRNYNSIEELVDDLRLMLENCYRYWGPSHKFTRKALRIEQKLENLITSLPESMRVKCEFVNEPVADETPEGIDETFKVVGFQSKMMAKVLRAQREQMMEEHTSEASKEKAAEMLRWEKEHLVTNEIKEEIKSLWPLAQIGFFLKICNEFLNLEEFTQYEIERMLLMPQESTTLATIMTSLLSPSSIRFFMDGSARIMPYKVWTARVKKKLEQWFGIYYEHSDVEAFRLCGIEPHFWFVFNLKNPLDSKAFHELTFHQRVWILKSLCDNLMINNKCIQEAFADNRELRETRLGNLQEYCYFYLPFLPEIRVYRQQMTEKKENFQNPPGDYNSLVIKYWDLTQNYSWNEQDDEMLPLPKSEDFYLVADSLDSLTELIDMAKEESVTLSKQLIRLYKAAEQYYETFEGLEALYSQWHDFRNKPDTPPPIDPLVKSPLKEEKETVKEEAPVLGKRRAKVKSCNIYANWVYDDYEEESEEEESFGSDSDSDSDWGKKGRKKTKKRRKTEEERELEGEPLEKRERKRGRKPNARDSAKANGAITVTPAPLDNTATMIANKSITISPVKPVGALDKNAPEAASLISNKSITITSVRPAPPASPMKNLITNRSITISNVGSSNIITKLSDSVSMQPVKSDDVIAISSSDDEDSESPVKKLGDAVTLKKILSSPQQARHISVSPSNTLSPRPKVTVISTDMLMQQRAAAAVSSPRHGSPRQWPRPMPPSIGKTPVRSPILRSPSQVSPRQRFPVSPGARAQSPIQPSQRMRSPYAASPRQRAPLPFSQSPVPQARGVRPTVARNLFNVPPNNVPVAEGILQVAVRPDGSFGYTVRLPDGGIINMSNREINEIRRKHNGSLPPKVQVPLGRRRP